MSTPVSSCGLNRMPIPPILNIEDGVRLILGILQKNVLCQHDVQDLKQGYEELDHLERHFAHIPNCNSERVLEAVVEKIKKIVRSENVSGRDLISLYQLQGFSDSIAIGKCFESAKEMFDEKKLKELGSHLPTCSSEADFEKAVGSLIGAEGLNADIVDVLKFKRERLQACEQTKREAVRKKAEFEELRRRNPQKYPPHLGHLLDKGYVQLYDHLLQMRDLPTINARRAEIGQKPFSTLSHIILETREAIIRKVLSAVPADSKEIVFLLGGAGAGKSTTKCLLEGHEMVLGNDFNYTSRSDKEGLIGEEDANSCTFLPTVEVVNGMVIIDFAGFNDTNGPLVSMGMEFALQELARQFRPKVFVLESITNIQDRYVNAAKLGARLARLFGNKEECILGITKYQKDPHFQKIKEIEERQRKELNSPSEQESNLKGQVEALQNFGGEGAKPKVAEFEQQLAGLRQARLERSRQPLPDTAEKLTHRREIERTEDELKRQIGLSKSISLADLENPNTLLTCMNVLSEHQGVVHVHPKPVLEEDNVKLLEDRFNEDLVKKLKIRNDDFAEFKDFKSFEERVLESSLIATVFSRQNPEIGAFLHLSQMDPNIVRSFDKRIASSCFEDYQKTVIGTLNLAYINKVLKEMEAQTSKEQVAELKKSWDRLRNYVMGLIGAAPDSVPEAERKWNEIHSRNEVNVKAIQEKYTLPTWQTVCLCVPAGIPFGIKKIIEWNAVGNANQQALLATMAECRGDLDRMYQTLQRLNDLRVVIENQEKIDREFFVEPISLESLDALKQSISKRIGKVRAAYGPDSWDKRVAFLADQLSLHPFDPSNPAHLSCLTAYAYSFLETDLTLACNPVMKLEQTTGEAVWSWLGADPKPLTPNEVKAFVSAWTKTKSGPLATVQFVSPQVSVWAQELIKNLSIVFEPIVKEAEERTLGLKSLADAATLKVRSADNTKERMAAKKAQTTAFSEFSAASSEFKKLIEIYETLTSWHSEFLQQEPKDLAGIIKRLSSILVETNKEGVKFSLQDFFVTALSRNVEDRTAVEVIGLGDAPRLVYDAADLPSRNLPLNRALLAAAILKKH